MKRFQALCIESWDVGMSFNGMSSVFLLCGYCRWNVQKQLFVFTHLNLQPKLLYELWEDSHIFIFHKFLFGAIFAATAYYFGRCSIVFLGCQGACSPRKFIKEINYAPEKFRWHHWDSNPWPLLCLCCALSYEATQSRSGQLVGLLYICSCERNDEWNKCSWSAV